MPVAYEHEYYRDTKDGNRQRCRQVSYHKVWDEFASVESANDDVKALTYIATRPLVYGKTLPRPQNANPIGRCANCDGAGWVDAERGGAYAPCYVCNPEGVKK